MPGSPPAICRVQADSAIVGPGAGSDTPDQPGLPVEFDIAATSGSVRSVLSTLRRTLAQTGLSTEELDTVELVVAEVLNNVVEHAYAGSGGGRVRLSAATDPRGLIFRIEDDGAPMPGGVLPASRAPMLATVASDLPEGGFGWFMIHGLTRDLVYRRDGPCNCLTFRMNVCCTFPG